MEEKAETFEAPKEDEAPVLPGESEAEQFALALTCVLDRTVAAIKITEMTVADIGKNKAMDKLIEKERNLLEIRSCKMRHYLMEKLVPVLGQAIVDLCKAQPEDPIAFLVTNQRRPGIDRISGETGGGAGKGSSGERRSETGSSNAAAAAEEGNGNQEGGQVAHPRRFRGKFFAINVISFSGFGAARGVILRK